MNVLVWGTGETGIEAAKEMLRQGHEVRLADERVPDKKSDISTKILTRDDFDWADLVVPSPGVPKDHPMFSHAKKVISEIEVAASLMKGKLIGITGTNGKTTTTTIIHRLMVEAGFNAGIGGNISPPLIKIVKDNPDYIVAEISSFQLEWIEKFRPDIAICLNVTPDHLDRYKTMEEYIYYKLRIFENQTKDDIAIINYDDALLNGLSLKAGRSGFSYSEPRGKEGVYAAGGRLYFYGSIEGVGPKIPDASRLGAGVIDDMMSAALVGRYLNIDVALMEEVFLNFKNIHHRFEFVEMINGVVFIDDSKATCVGAVDRALESIDSKAVIILGGKDKGGDFAKLIRPFVRKLRKAVLIGEASDRIETELKGIVETVRATDMTDAVSKAFMTASKGDTVLLSPGCASFDMFRSYAQRGEVYSGCVRELKKMN